MARVLIVDDEKSIRLTLSAFLRGAGHQVQAADSVDEAIALLEEQDMDVVISDIILPRVTGVQLLQRLKETRPQLQVILMTGEPTVETVTKALRAEAFDYLVKPVAKADVIRAVANAARVKELEDERRRLEKENIRYQQHLEELVQQRTDELRQSESLLRQAQKMEAIGKLAGGVAHDFNNLLMVIGGSAEFLQEETTLSDTAKGDVREILAATRRASDLTRQLLAFSRRQTLLKETLDLAAVVRGVSKMLQRLLGEDVSLKVDADQGPYMVLVDPGQIEQVLMNLATNARDAMPRGGVLSIELSRVTLDEATVNRLGAGEDLVPGEHICLSVSDTGCGMTAETQALIFDPFFTTKPEGQGTGLGLSTVYGIVRQHDGHVSVQSEVQAGTVFRIHLPVPALHCDEADPDMVDDLPEGQGTILFVEDDASVGRIGRRMLENLGYTVFAAATPTEAMQVAREQGGQIDLLLTDVIMPGMNGPDLAKRILADWPHMQVLYASGYPADHLDNRGVKSQQISLLRKPFVRDELARKLRELLESRGNPGPSRPGESAES